MTDQIEHWKEMFGQTDKALVAENITLGCYRPKCEMYMRIWLAQWIDEKQKLNQPIGFVWPKMKLFN